MDPLGAVPASVKLESLARWNTTNVPEYDILVDDPSNMRQSPFMWNDNINSKIALWCVSVVDVYLLLCRSHCKPLHPHHCGSVGICGDFEIWLSKIYKMLHPWDIVWLQSP